MGIGGKFAGVRRRPGERAWPVTPRGGGGGGSGALAAPSHTHTPNLTLTSLGAPPALPLLWQPTRARARTRTHTRGGSMCTGRGGESDSAMRAVVDGAVRGYPATRVPDDLKHPERFWVDYAIKAASVDDARARAWEACLEQTVELPEDTTAVQEVMPYVVGSIERIAPITEGEEYRCAHASGARRAGAPEPAPACPSSDAACAT